MTDNTLVKRNDADSRYDITVDGALAGFSQFLDRDGRRIFFHTEIDADFGGRGLGTELVKEALTDTVGDGLTIVPVCPLVRAYVSKHDTFDANVSKAQPADLAALDER